MLAKRLQGKINIAAELSPMGGSMGVSGWQTWWIAACG